MSCSWPRPRGTVDFRSGPRAALRITVEVAPCGNSAAESRVFLVLACIHARAGSQARLGVKPARNIRRGSMGSVSARSSGVRRASSGFVSGRGAEEFMQASTPRRLPPGRNGRRAADPARDTSRFSVEKRGRCPVASRAITLHPHRAQSRSARPFHQGASGQGPRAGTPAHGRAGRRPAAHREPPRGTASTATGTRTRSRSRSAAAVATRKGRRQSASCCS